jgi:hypothetical protein
MTRISARRAEVLASYGKRKPMNAKKKKPDPNNDLPIHAPIAMRRELERVDKVTAIRKAKEKRQETLNNNALKNKPKLNLTDEDRCANKKASDERKNSEVNGLKMMGFLTAATAKALASTKSSIGMETSAPYFNYQDNFIENQYHGKTSAFDVRHNDLIETDLETGKMLWHGDTCAICKMPPSTMGEVVLAQYGTADFVCVDCGKLVETKGLGMRGWTFDTINMAEEDDDE